MNVDDVTWTDPTCPVARTLDLVGDRWSLLIIRDAMDNARSFTDFHQRTGVARNILTDRLRRLVDHGILERETAISGRRQVYVLTDAGRDLFTIIVAMRQWGERHAFADDEAHSALVDESGNPLGQLRPTDAHGHRVDVDSTQVIRNNE
ncbi:HxlR family transcriptional regulator [Mycolicibacterium vaccae ATCC 25954]|uniref:HxlR family transcriptional regulator n=1 Tax=Mycolicibacterium vaccae ATCC 25954 TaxID=1194972 RepID=K0UJG3_MYCVA|nr:helix-turn-helix domain-containing protein [Mycolicibacterium vaccae]ANI40422.1 ArsR family transcriptional regulator [Mycolicibacterium vaccae 95051]EJZ05115.1 HxlR family transcriptional regulator [Mycolicibacterium vaccae ATCC 25954]